MVNSKNLAAAKNIERAVSHKNTFVFGELLSLQNVQDLQSTEHTKYLNFIAIVCIWYIQRLYK